MTLDIHTQGKISAWTSFVTFATALTLSQVLSMSCLVISGVAGVYSIYCFRLTVKKRKLEIEILERQNREADKISRN